MSTLSSANVTDVNLVLKEHAHKIKMKISMHPHSNSYAYFRQLAHCTSYEMQSNSCLCVCGKPVRCLTVIIALLNPQLKNFTLNWVVPHLGTQKTTTHTTVLAWYWIFLAAKLSITVRVVLSQLQLQLNFALNQDIFCSTHFKWYTQLHEYKVTLIHDHITTHNDKSYSLTVWMVECLQTSSITLKIRYLVNTFS